jgi:hypothetical protein
VGVTVYRRCDDVAGDLAVVLGNPDQPPSMTSTQGLLIGDIAGDQWQVDCAKELAGLDLEHDQVGQLRLFR